MIHNDWHPGNISSIPRDLITWRHLDFGDLVCSPRVGDLGVALGYLVPDDGPLLWPLEGFTAGIENVVPLTDDERAVLPSSSPRHLSAPSSTRC